MLFSSHAMLAALTKIPEFEIDESEAKSLAEASMRVARHYNIIPDEKTQDIINLIFVLCGVYGTRAMAFRNRVANEEARKRDNVVDIKPVVMQ